MSDLSASPQRPATTSVWEDFIDIFYAPAAVFARRENGTFWIPALVVTVCIGGIFLATSGLLSPMFEAEFERSMRQRPGITAQQIEQGRQFAAVAAKVGVFIGTPLVLVTVGIVLWLVGKLFDSAQTLRSALVVTAYSYMPKVIETALTGVQGLIVDPSTLDGRFRLSLGIGRFLDPDTTSPIVLGLLGRVDLFTIWVTVLLAIGLAVTGRISRGKAALAGVLVWIAGALPPVLAALRS